jgi:hypothetical protein
MRIKELIKNIWRFIALVLRWIIPIAIGAGILWSIFWFVKTGYSQLFKPQKALVSVKLTDAYVIDLERKNRCLTEGLDPIVYIQRSSFELPNSPTVNYDITSATPIQISLGLPLGELRITKYLGDKVIADNPISVHQSEGYAGTIKSITIEMTKLKRLIMEQYYCAPITRFTPGGVMTFSSHDGSPLQIATKQWFSDGDNIKIVIEPIDIIGFGDQKYDKIELMLNVTANVSIMGLMATSTVLSTTLPGVGYDRLGVWKNDIDSFLAFADSIKIERPAGTIKIGNNHPVEMIKLSDFSKEILELPYLSVDNNGGFVINSHITDGVYDISGNTSSAVLNGQQLVKSKWETLPEYLQAGLFGTLLSIIGGLWAFRHRLWNFITPKKVEESISKVSPPPSGSFVCVTQSGDVIAGELIRGPSFFFPYYLLRNTRHKKQHKEEWSAEIIGEIRVRASLVEQSYMLGESEATVKKS